MSQRFWMMLGLCMVLAFAVGTLRADEESPVAEEQAEEAVDVSGEDEAAEEPSGDDEASEEAPAEEEASDEAAAGESGEEMSEQESEQDRQLRELDEADEELEGRSQELAERCRQAESPEEKGQAQEELRGVIAEHFEVRQKRRAMELTQLETQIEALRKEIEKREAMKEKLIDRRAVELVGESEEVEF